jgi:hypothetical protein
MSNPIRRLLWIILLVPVAAACRPGSPQSDAAPSASGSASQAGPRIVFDQPVFDFGKVPEGEALKHVFVARNAGTSTLVLDKVVTSCGCTAAVLKGNEVAPGATGEIEVTFNSRGMPGAVQKTVSVTSNDPTNPRVTLTFKAQVELELGFEPRAVVRSVEPGSKDTFEVWLTGRLAEGASLAVAEISAPESVAAEVVRDADAGPPRQGVRIRLKGAKVGQLSANVAVTTGVEKAPRLSIPVNLTVPGNIEVSPRSVYFPPDTKTDLERVLRVTSKRADFRLRAVRVASGPFAASQAKPETGPGVEVRVRVAQGGKIEAATTGTLELLTNDPLEPTIAIPINSISPRLRLANPLLKIQ